LPDAILHQRFPPLRAALPRVELCDLPTPVRALRSLGDVWMKDDGRSAPLWGGNKPRKTEWLLGDARRRGRSTVLTFGALGTNHGLATARYARANGFACVLALTDQPVDDHVTRQLARIHASGAHVYVTHTKVRTALALPYLLTRHGRAYAFGPGGSTPVGALGFVEAALELGAQVRAGELPEPATVWHALGSGGTAAGLVVGLRLAGLRTVVKAVHVNDQLRLDERTILRLAERTERLLRDRGARLDGLPSAAEQLDVVGGQLGGGYGHGTPQAREAIERLRDAEDVTLDPVYTGKAMAGLLAAHAGGTLDAPALYWHTYNAIPD
jgi:D-cysteine desulfhydrase